MHIPDGYLSPSTCATFYAASAPFWWVAFRRLKRALSGRTIPLLAVFAAFSFVVMMFNLPLPGGTTGHAVGVAMSAIVLGPEMAILATSMALLMQALFFGDGGITTYGANCFNMGIVGALVGYAVYRLAAGGSSLRARRRVFAAGAAGYAAINAAAFCAAVEFGVQPLWFHDAHGAPLYAPYPLAISIPAMMIGHLTIAGLAELTITAGMVAYLQQTNVDLLRQTAGDETGEAVGFLPLRGLLVALAVLVILTPLGLLATGTAWGEWKPGELGVKPEALGRLYGFWRAPLREYAPSWIGNAAAGYLVSSVLGVGLIVAAMWIARRLLTRSAGRRGGFLEKTLSGLISAGQEALFAENTARADGILQRLDARVKLAGFCALAIAAVCARRLAVLVALFALSALGAMVARIPLRRIIEVWVAVLAFTGAIALPAALLGGLRSALFLVLRAETTATLSQIVIATTIWSRLLRALRFLGVPAAIVAMASMTYRYIFVFLETAKQTLEARQTRLVGRLEPAQERRLAAASVGALLDKTLLASNEVHAAMLARGFRGEVHLLEDLEMRTRDWWQLSGLLAVAGIAAGLGR